MLVHQTDTSVVLGIIMATQLSGKKILWDNKVKQLIQWTKKAKKAEMSVS